MGKNKKARKTRRRKENLGKARSFHAAAAVRSSTRKEETDVEAQDASLAPLFNAQKVSALNLWFTDSAQGPERINSVATALGQRGTIIFRSLRNERAANKDPDMTQRIVDEAKKLGWEPPAVDDTVS